MTVKRFNVLIHEKIDKFNETIEVDSDKSISIKLINFSNFKKYF